MEMEKEKERAKQMEMEKERVKQMEKEKERAKQLEMEKERAKQMEMEKEKERVKQMEMVKERAKQMEMEQEKERAKQMEMEKQRDKEREAQKSLKQNRVRANLEQRIQMREQKMAQIRSSANVDMGDLLSEWLEIDSVFSEVMTVVEDVRKEALRPLEERRRRIKREEQDLVQKLQREVDELKTIVDKLDENPHLQVLALDESEDWKNLTIDSSFSFGTLRNKTSSLMEQIQHKLEKLSSVVFGDDAEADGATEAPTCSPDMCNVLRQFGAMTEKLRSVEARLTESEAKLTETEARLAVSDATLTDRESKLNDSESKLQELNKESTVVIFSAALGTDGNVGPFDVDTILLFKSVITNIGDAYNNETGAFSAPVTGFYYFSMFYHAGGQNDSKLVLKKNSDPVITTHDHKTENDPADNGANAVFIHLQKDDQVFVILPAGSHVWGSSQQTTFSGFLVSEVWDPIRCVHPSLLEITT